jgi:hypothetical protein
MKTPQRKDYLKNLVLDRQSKDSNDERNKTSLNKIIDQGLSNSEIDYIFLYVTNVEKESGERSVRIKEIILGNVISVKLECLLQFEHK